MKASTAILEWSGGAKDEPARLTVVSYVVTSRKSDEIIIKILRVVPARMEDSLLLGKPFIPDRETKTAILRRLGAMEFGLLSQPQPNEGGVR